MLTLHLPQTPPAFSAALNEVLLVTNADLRESANVECWPVQKRFEQRLSDVLQERFGVLSRRAHLVKGDKGHGFISSQREGKRCKCSGIQPGQSAPGAQVLAS